jgi:protein-tyrosine phosphatase
MAEFIFKKIIIDKSLESYFIIDSRAVSSEEIGNDTYYKTKELLLKNHIPFTHRMASKITPSECRDSAYLICMDDSNVSLLKRICPISDYPKIHKLTNFLNLDSDIIDPWYSRNFEKCYDDIQNCCMALLDRLILENNLIK